MNKPTKPLKSLPLSLLGSAVLAGSLATGAATADSTSPFAAIDLGSGYQLASVDSKGGEGKCGEAKCGADMASDKMGEGKCGEGKCGSK
jgi:uncharacterized low-complexity protein